jgi:hypothetical protein
MAINSRIAALAAAAALAPVPAAGGVLGTLAEVAIHDRTEHRVLPVYRHEGRHYVVGKPGNEYQIRVRNRGDGDTLNVVSVDGVNAISGETADWNQSGYVLAPEHGFDVKGWRKSLRRVAAFYFTEHARSYAARTGRPDHVGVIGVAVFRRRPEPAAHVEPPRAAPHRESAPDAPYPASADAQAGSRAAATEARHGPSAGAPAAKPAPLGTGHGRSESSHVTYTRFERDGDAPAEVIAIHYDTYANLVARGVIAAPRIAHPSPFPGRFTPDPR